MGNQKSLLKNVSVGLSGRMHPCKRNKDHKLPKGAKMLVVKEDRREFHYCADCGAKSIANARTILAQLKGKFLAVEQSIINSNDERP
jgi:hypothetical protein